MYAILDIETTGAKAKEDKITEIAIYVHDGKKVVNSFSSLINPETHIPPFISNLTGISNDMVEGAPKFYEVAKDILSITEGMIIVAHNAQFDYSFIRNEYKSLGYNFRRDTLCTVRLSRRLIPGKPSYSLGKLCRNLGIEITDRHRASGDALATTKLFELLLDSDKEALIEKSVSGDFYGTTLPVGLDREVIDNLPEDVGVYYFFNEKNEVIYVGKSTNIRKRVLSHFADKKSNKEFKMRSAVMDVGYEVTGNELIALLLESDEIKTRKPYFNTAQKRTYYNYGIFSYTDDSNYKRVIVEKIKGVNADPLIAFNGKAEAFNVLEKKLEEFELCQKYCGLYDSDGACFNRQIRTCKGACVGEEDAKAYNRRVDKLISSLDYEHKSFLIIGEGREKNERSIVKIEAGKYVGFGYIDTELNGYDVDQLKDSVKNYSDNKDIKQIIRAYLRKNKHDLILRF